MDNYQENLNRLQRFAHSQNLILNPDQARVEKIVGKMSKNYEITGEYICPCKQKNDPPLPGQEILCPCSDIMDEISEDGHCHCRLFFTSPKAKKTKT